MKFQAFVDAHKNRVSTKKVKFSRISEPFEIRTLTEDETSRLRKKHTRYKKNAKGIEVPEIDTNEYSRDVTATSVIYPDLTDAELQAEFGTEGSYIKTLSEILTAGEYQSLQAEVMDFSGFNEDLEEIKDEVKNELMQGK